MLLLSSLAVAAVVAQEKQPKVDESDVDEDMGLDEEEIKVLMAEDEEEEEEEEATVMDGEHSDEADDKGTGSRKSAIDANVSFQVRKG